MRSPVRAWAKAVGVVYPATYWPQRAVELAYQDALAARGLPTCMNSLLVKEDRRA